ncbi:hypothetical protein THASP1DRAFT_26326 [Thamnocephalis sphaerospora]|uniref:Rhodanese domain-containing protein n=1 Tax=Thamnocephalis sphaerospora TaxID=78915 RepID=A0A4P9XHG2_9FUNG|nr:hypothetical protein THASP1DRAFT_26326 [Thamnocephalis sphaerospora]|eukprot:RKP05125.1 hypothetical protein THASP1DRAFT_26326 [Thamnocephalis sphaerospora]
MTVSSASTRAVVSSTVEYIDCDTLADMLRDTTLTPRVDYVVVDGGNIPSAINVPAHKLTEQLEHLVTAYGHVPKIIFHCALSQVRGPRSAGLYHKAALMAAETVETNPSPDATIVTQDVLVLRGGFALWQARFKDHTDMIENYDRELWELEY